MEYKNICEGKFLRRPNRFIAHVLVNGVEEICHVKNTGRCRELLVENCKVYLQESDNPNRKTKFDLVAVQKGDRLINMDSQIPNGVVEEWLRNNKPFGEEYEPFSEQTFLNSRFDFCLKSNKTDSKIYVEVKGCTLEENGVVLFPDAPTQRGLKHINELVKCVELGFGAVIIILVQMSDVLYFTPNYNTHRAFGEALKMAKEKGVTVLCFDSVVTPKSIELNKPVEVRFEED